MTMIRLVGILCRCDMRARFHPKCQWAGQGRRCTDARDEREHPGRDRRRRDRRRSHQQSADRDREHGQA